MPDLLSERDRTAAYAAAWVQDGTRRLVQDRFEKTIA
jgi:hypothetical protein